MEVDSSVDGLEVQHHRLESIVVNSQNIDKVLDEACIGWETFMTPTVKVCFALSLRIFFCYLTFKVYFFIRILQLELGVCRSGWELLRAGISLQIGFSSEDKPGFGVYMRTLEKPKVVKKELVSKLRNELAAERKQSEGGIKQ